MKRAHKVLIVDDHPGIRQALKTHLERMDTFRVVGDIGRGADLPWALQTLPPVQVPQAPATLQVGSGPHSLPVQEGLQQVLDAEQT